MNNNFLRIKVDDVEDKHLSYLFKVYRLIDKLLKKHDDKYIYDYEVKDVKGNTVVDIQIKCKNS